MRGVASAIFDRRIELDADSARNVGQLQPVDGPLREVVFGRLDQRFGIEQVGTTDVPIDLHPLIAAEADLRRFGHAAAIEHGRIIGSQDTGSWAADSGAGMLEHRGGRQDLRGRLNLRPVFSDALPRRVHRDRRGAAGRQGGRRQE